MKCNLPGIQVIPYQSQSAAGVVPFRFQPELNITDLSQFDQVQKNQSLARDLNLSLDRYSAMLQEPIRLDGDACDLNSRQGISSMTTYAPGDPNDVPYKALVEFVPNPSKLNQTITRAQLAGVSKVFDLATDRAGLATITMSHPFAGAALSVVVDTTHPSPAIRP